MAAVSAHPSKDSDVVFNIAFGVGRADVIPCHDDDTWGLAAVLDNGWAGNSSWTVKKRLIVSHKGGQKTDPRELLIQNTSCRLLLAALFHLSKETIQIRR